MEFVTFEIAKKLKEKWFDYPCNMYYHIHNDIADCVGSLESTCDCSYDFINSKNKYRCAAPTISQVLKWLRKEKDIDLVISPVFFYDDVLGRMRDYGCKVFAPSLNKPEHCGYHEKWEQAALAGIEYVLDNLI